MKKIALLAMAAIMLFASCTFMNQTHVTIENRAGEDVTVLDVDLTMEVAAGESIEYYVPHGERWLFCHNEDRSSVWLTDYEARWAPRIFYLEGAVQ